MDGPCIRAFLVLSLSLASVLAAEDPRTQLGNDRVVLQVGCYDVTLYIFQSAFIKLLCLFCSLVLDYVMQAFVKGPLYCLELTLQVAILNTAYAVPRVVRLKRSSKSRSSAFNHQTLMIVATKEKTN